MSTSDPVRSIIAWCRTNESYRYLAPGACSWPAGGCALLALAVHELLPEVQLWGLESDGRLHHVMMRYHGRFFDGSGLWSNDPGAMARRWEEKEGVAVTKCRPLAAHTIAQDSELWSTCTPELIEPVREALAPLVQGVCNPAEDSAALNTAIDYCYRDYEGYREHGQVVLRGLPTGDMDDFGQALRASLIDGTDFIAAQLGLPEVFPWLLRADPIRTIDHCWHELSMVRATGEAPTLELTPAGFLAKAQAIRGKWRPFDIRARKPQLAPVVEIQPHEEHESLAISV